MISENMPLVHYANKKQIFIAFTDLSYRLSRFEMKSLTIYDFIDIFNKKYKLTFQRDLVQEVFNDIYKKKKKVLANYYITKKYLTNLKLKFSILDPDSYTIQDLINQLNKDKKYYFNNIIIKQIFNELESNS